MGSEKNAQKKRLPTAMNDSRQSLLINLQGNGRLAHEPATSPTYYSRAKAT